MELNRNDSISNLKLRILVTFNNTFFEKFRGKFNYKESYNIKKSVNEVLIFNDNIIKTLSERVKLSPILLHFKSINESLSSEYNTYFKIHKLRNKRLEKIYTSLFVKFKIFINSFLDFIDLKDTEIRDYIQSYLKSESVISNGRKFNSTSNIISPLFNESLATSEQKNEVEFEDEIYDNNEKIFRMYINDLQSTLNYINNIIVDPCFINIIVNDIKLSNFEVVYHFTLSYIENSKLIEISDTINSGDLKRYCDQHVFHKCKLLKDISYLIKHAKEVIINKDENYFKKNLSRFLQKLLSDLFFMDKNLFLMFKLNEMIVFFKVKVEDSRKRN